ncbi:MAG: 5-(carboxyamino)imidazole ribonucleotide mutase [bacterium]
MKPKIGLLFGSSSDLPVIEKGLQFLKSMGVPHACRVASAHRTPDLVEKLIAEWEANGVQVFIAGAGGAAHLGGAVAARTLKPVIGIPIGSSSLKGLDALLSTVQMPSGVPVATVAIDAGVNACFLACQILAIKDPKLAKRLADYREKKRREIIAASS